MRFDPPLLSGILQRRYKRFLADVSVQIGSGDAKVGGPDLITMHCPNTGAMTGCAEPGSRVWFSTATNPKRKYRHTLELVETGAGGRIGINSARANGLVAEALDLQGIVELGGYPDRVREVPIPDERGRFDLRLTHPRRRPCFVEIKSVTLCLGDGLGVFPDAPSERAVRHAQALERRARAGERAVLLFCVQHTGITRVGCADAIDPTYGQAVGSARAAGVEVLCYGTNVAPDEVRLTTALPFIFPLAPTDGRPEKT